MDVDHMLSVLVENKIVNNVRPRSVSELRGTFNYLGSAYQVPCSTWCFRGRVPRQVGGGLLGLPACDDGVEGCVFV